MVRPAYIEMYFDSHAHYDDERFDCDREPLLSKMGTKDSVVISVINVGSNIQSSKASVVLAEAFSFIRAAVGVHPHDTALLTDGDMETLRELCVHPKTVAVGEIGLDFYYDNSPREVQRYWFEKQLILAKEMSLPVVIHSRDAAADTMNIIKESSTTRGVLHCYSGHLPMALEYIEMGFYIGIGGVVTYKNAQKTREVAAGIPLERLLIETDAPYLSPVPFRGKRNESSYLKYVVEAIAAARGITSEEVAKASTENAERLFG